jgi:hypothetical protein
MAKPSKRKRRQRTSIRTDTPRELGAVFSSRRLTNAWKRTVRAGLRHQPLDDLHDYLDYHWNIEGIAIRVRNQILDGLYRPSPPVIIRFEKGNGVCRRMVMPAPEDALSLQALVDYLEPLVKAKRPCESAYYSRSHDYPKIEDVDGTFSYPWFLLWPEFQERIWKFSEARKWTVATDVASYYDNIPLPNLRHQLAKLTAVEGPVLDFLFFVLEAFVWRPDYIPHSGIGLPQINFDTPRLLAHAYLYPADLLVQKHVGSDFVRWMDDIDFGVDTRQKARTALRELDELLASYGVRLNGGKTKVMNQEEAARHFWIGRNRRLTMLKERLDATGNSAPEVAVVRASIEDSFRRFDRALKRGGLIGQWSKVLKRYLDLLGKCESVLLEPRIPRLLRDHPDLREAALRYLLRLGFTPRRLRMLVRYVRIHCIDDASLFAVTRVLIAWRIPATSEMRQEVIELAGRLGRSRQFVKFVCGLWLMTKYASSRRLGNYVRYQTTTWTKYAWAARQVAAVLPRLPGNVAQLVQTSVAAHGHTEAAQVIAHYRRLQKLETLPIAVASYLVPSPEFQGSSYSLPKVLLFLALNDGALKRSVLRRLERLARGIAADPVYSELLA